MEVLIFPTTTVLDIEPIPIDKFYYSLVPRTNFSIEENQAYLTSVLIQIAKYDRNTFNDLYSLNHFHSIFSSKDPIKNLRNNFIINRIIPDIDSIPTDELGELLKYNIDYYSLMDIFGKDTDLGESKRKTFSAVLLFNGEYFGHINCWINRFDDISAQGIRTSIYNSLTNKIKGVSYVLIDALIKYAKVKDLDSVMIVQPLPVMMYVLKKYGFKPISFDNQSLNYIFDTKKSIRKIDPPGPYILTIL